MAAKTPPEQPELPSNRELRTTAQACAQLGCSRDTIRKLWKEGKLERVRFGGQTRITARSLNALVDEVLTGDRLHPPKREREDQ
jgi:excisionase family DNA binding protein